MPAVECSVVAEFDMRAVPFAADNHGVELGDGKVNHRLTDPRDTLQYCWCIRRWPTGERQRSACALAPLLGSAFQDLRPRDALFDRVLFSDTRRWICQQATGEVL